MAATRLTLASTLLALLAGCSSVSPSMSPTSDSAAEAAREHQRQKSISKKYARSAARQIMDEVGGGKDLVVDVTEWDYDSYAHEFEITMEMSFNGAIFRNNNYAVDGVLSVKEDGSKASFARTYSNERFKKLEGRLKFAAGAAATAIILNELSKD